MKTAAPLALAAALLGPVLLGACRLCRSPGSGRDPGVVGREILEVPAGAAGALSVQTDAGNVEALSFALPGTVRVVARTSARNAEDLAAIRVFAEQVDGVIRVGYETSRVLHGAGVSFTVEAPPSLALRLRSSAGSLRARGFAAGMEANTSAGSIRAEDVRGDLVLETSAGSIEVTGADGTVKALTGAGSVEVSGRLRGAGALESGAGSVSAVLPGGSRLRVSGSTSVGSVDVDFPVTTASDFAGGRFEGTLGDGAEGSLRMKTSAGSVVLRRGD